MEFPSRYGKATRSWVFLQFFLFSVARRMDGVLKFFTIHASNSFISPCVDITVKG